jgi:hypothetical protein
MFDLNLITHETPDRHLLIHLLEGLHTMALDLSALTAAVAKVSADVDALILADVSAAQAAAATTVADQAQVAALLPAITAISAKAEAALAPAPVAPAPAA